MGIGIWGDSKRFALAPQSKIPTPNQIMERIPITRRTGESLLAASLVVIAGILFLRRMLTDEFADLPAGEVALWAAVFAALAVWAARRLSPVLPAQMPLSLAFLFSIAFAAGLSADALDTFAGIFAIVAVVALPFLADFARSSLDSGNRTGIRENLAEQDPTPDSRLPIPDSRFDDEAVSQTLTRRMIGNDCYIEGMIAFEIPAGELVHQLHVPFWPALPAAPIVECEIDDCDARVRVPLAAAHGLRIEIRACEPSAAARSGILHFTAHASAGRAAA